MKANVCVIAGILVIGSAFFSCVTNKDVTARGTSKGIELHFGNISEDIDRMFVLMFDDTVKDVVKNFADIRGNKLEDIKKAEYLFVRLLKQGMNIRFLFLFIQKKDLNRLRDIL